VSLERSLPENLRRRAERFEATVLAYQVALSSLHAVRQALLNTPDGERHPIAADQSTLRLLSITERVIRSDLANISELARGARRALPRTAHTPAPTEGTPPR